MTNLYPKSFICRSIVNDYYDFKDLLIKNKSYFRNNSTSKAKILFFTFINN